MAGRVGNKTVQLVSAYCTRSEVTGVSVTVLFILVFWGLGVYGRARIEDEFEVESWQVDVFAELNSNEQGIYTDLQIAAEEISQIYSDENNYWPNLSQLVEYGIPPFVQDISWQERGSIEWYYKTDRSENSDAVYYLGVPTDASKAGAFLMIIHRDLTSKLGSEIEPNIVWYRSECTGWPDSCSESYLISCDWKELVAYSGEDEYTRLKGDSE